MNKADIYFRQVMQEIKYNGSYDKNPRPKYADGTPAYTRFITQHFEQYDLSKGEFPITTLRNTAIKTAITEILWIYQLASNDLKVLNDLNCNWWNEFDIGNSTIGFRYGHTIQRYGLMYKLLDGLINNPFGRRHIINLWQEEEFKDGDGLHPCAYETLWSVRKVGGEMHLDMTLIQRSSDFLMAKVINSIQYVGLQMMVAGHCGYKVGKFAHFIQNAHIYDRHEWALDELLNRKPSDYQPSIQLVSQKDFYEYKADDFIINQGKVEKLSRKLEIAI